MKPRFGGISGMISEKVSVETEFVGEESRVYDSPPRGGVVSTREGLEPPTNAVPELADPVVAAILAGVRGHAILLLA